MGDGWPDDSVEVTKWERGGVEWTGTGGYYTDGSFPAADVVEFLTARSEAPRTAAASKRWDHNSVEVSAYQADVLERALREAGVEFEREPVVVSFRVSVKSPPRPRPPLR